MKAGLVLVLGAVVLQVFGAGEEEVRAKGKAIVAAATGTLSTNLLQAIGNGGFTNAISFCSVHALPLTGASATNEPGVVLRRVALKLRNPANAPDGMDRRVLEKFMADAASGKALAPLVEALPGETRYYEPIVIQNPLCLNCHGQPGAQIQRETLELIRRLYPLDAATGFKTNDLRGAWRVSFREGRAGEKR